MLRFRNIAESTPLFVQYLSVVILHFSCCQVSLIYHAFFLHTNLLNTHCDSIVFQTTSSLVLHVECGAMTNYRADVRSSTALENAAATNIVSSSSAGRTIARSTYWLLCYYDHSVDLVSYEISLLLFQVILVLHFVAKFFILLS